MARREGMRSATALLLSTCFLLPLAANGQALERRSGEEVVRYQCVHCHGSGVGGAPRIGDREAWRERTSQGIERLVRSAIQGRGAMPPKGGLHDLSREELRAAILSMSGDVNVAPAPGDGAVR